MSWQERRVGGPGSDARLLVPESRIAAFTTPWNMGLDQVAEEFIETLPGQPDDHPVTRGFNGEAYTWDWHRISGKEGAQFQSALQLQLRPQLTREGQVGPGGTILIVPYTHHEAAPDIFDFESRELLWSTPIELAASPISRQHTLDQVREQLPVTWNGLENFHQRAPEVTRRRRSP
jgi:hypothetical protein